MQVTVMQVFQSWKVLALVAAFSLAPASFAAAQEVKTIRFAKQFGIGYLPMVIMENMKLVEKYAAAQGLGDVKAEWSELTGGSPINDALISGQIDFGAGGVGPLLTIWAKTQGSLNVKGVGALNAMPLYLNTIEPNVKTLQDFTEKHRIALPSVKVSIQAVTLQMAAEKAFGEGKHDILDRLTVSMSHPDGMTAMMSGNSEIAAHFTSAPFMYQELDDPRVRRVLSSYEVLGGPGSFNLMWCKQEFFDKSPKSYMAVFDALQEAIKFINERPDQAAEIWAAAEKSKLKLDLIKKIIADPENRWTSAPLNLMTYASFMHKVGAIKIKPNDWKDIFFPPLHSMQGS